MNHLKLILLLVLGVWTLSCSSETAPEQNKDAASTEQEAGAESVAVQASETSGVTVGDKAPMFELKNVDGKMYALQSIKDAKGEDPKGYILIFTCNTCPYAVASEQRIIDLHEKYAPKGYPVVAVQPNDPAAQPGDSFQKMQERAEEKGFPFLYLFDEGQEIYPKYGATRTPEVFLLDDTFTVRYHGAIDDSVREPEGVEQKFVEDAIKAMEKGKDPEPATTKAIGCTIKTV